MYLSNKGFEESPRKRKKAQDPKENVKNRGFYGDGYVDFECDNIWGVISDDNDDAIKQYYDFLNDNSEDSRHTVMCYFKKTEEEKYQYDFFLRKADKEPLFVNVNCPYPTEVRFSDHHADIMLWRGNTNQDRLFILIDDNSQLIKFTKCTNCTRCCSDIKTIKVFSVYWCTNKGIEHCPVCKTKPSEDMSKYLDFPIFGLDVLLLNPGI